jgi:hypothetical protein
MEDIILENTPNSERARQIIIRRQRELDDKLRIHEYKERLKKYMKNPIPQGGDPIFRKSPGIGARSKI